MIYTLREGDRGQPVADMQGKLTRCKADGIWGPKTSRALKAYQRKHKLAVDAVAGPETLGQMRIYPVLVLDASHWQGRVDWSAVKAAGADVVILKCSEGLTHADSRYPEHLRGASEAGLLVGAYHYGRSGNDPVTEAGVAVKRALGVRKVHLDVESHDGMPPDELGQWIAAWCAEVERLTGTTGMIYTARWFARPHLDDGAAIPEDGRWPLWAADYVRDARQVASEWDGAWDRHLLWQWTASARWPGFKGRVDANWLFSADGEAAPCSAVVADADYETGAHV